MFLPSAHNVNPVKSHPLFISISGNSTVLHIRLQLLHAVCFSRLSIAFNRLFHVPVIPLIAFTRKVVVTLQQVHGIEETKVCRDFVGDISATQPV